MTRFIISPEIVFPGNAAAFPVVEGTPATHDKSNTDATDDFALPTGITSGELLIFIYTGVLFASENPPSGWTQLFSLGSTGEPPRTRCWVRDADGLEGTTLTLSTGLRAVSVCYRISGARGASFVEAGTSTSAGTPDTAPDSPSLTPTWGAKNTLWITGAGIGTTDYTLNSIPTNYTDEVSIIGTGSTNSQNGIATARRELNAATENPGAFALNQAENWNGFTIAVEPAP